MLSSSLALFGLMVCGNIFSVLGQQTSDVCPSYNASKIKLVTFDCFAALMALENSMLENVAKILPALSSSDVDTLVGKWEGAYGDAIGTTFDEAETGAFPFSWLISTELQKILDEMQITVTRSEFSQLVQSWGNLRPWKNTQETLEKVHAAGISIGVLSNGDRYTLTQAVSIFTTVPFAHVFPTDFPVGAFKPLHFVYDATKEVGFAVDEILHVAGSPYDGVGARDAGLFSAVTHSTSRRGLKLRNASSDAGAVGEMQPCFNLGDISEVVGILGL